MLLYNILISSDVCASISKNHLQELSAYKTHWLVGVQGSSLTIHGCATVNLHLDNRTIKTDVVVACPLITDAFVRKYEARLSTGS